MLTRKYVILKNLSNTTNDKLVRWRTVPLFWMMDPSVQYGVRTVLILIEMRELEPQILFMLTYIVDKLGQRDISGIFACLRQEFLKYRVVGQWAVNIGIHFWLLNNACGLTIQNNLYSKTTSETIVKLNWVLRKYIVYTKKPHLWKIKTLPVINI